MPAVKEKTADDIRAEVMDLTAAEWTVVFCRLALEMAERVNREEVERDR